MTDTAKFIAGVLSLLGLGNSNSWAIGFATVAFVPSGSSRNLRCVSPLRASIDYR